MYHRQINETADAVKSYQLKKAGLKGNNKALVIATQKQHRTLINPPKKSNEHRFTSLDRILDTYCIKMP